MQIDREALLRHYGMLLDGELLALNRDELTDVAQTCYDEEMERRGLLNAVPEGEAADEEYYEDDELEIPQMVQGEEPEWLPDAACACSFTSYQGGSAASEASEACESLLMAGVPCYLVTTDEESPEGAPPRYLYSVMVPGAMNLQAASVLDRDLFNPRLEDEWRAHFEALTDEELAELTPEVICAGLQDRIDRLTRVHAEEVARRQG